MTTFNPDSLGPRRIVTDKFGVDDRRTLSWRGDFREATFRTGVYRPGMFGGGTSVEKMLATVEKIMADNTILGATVAISRNGYRDEDELVIRGWVAITDEWREHRDSLVAEETATRVADEERRKEGRRRQYLALKEEFGE